MQHLLSRLTYPLIQAPMLGVQNEALTIAACNAGALGSLPCAMYSHPPKVSDKARRRRQYAFVRRGDATPYEAFGGWL